MSRFRRLPLHHVHADDVAQPFQKSMEHSEEPVGNSIHICSPAALSMIGYAESVAAWYGREARVRFLPWEEWRKGVTRRLAHLFPSDA